MTVDPIALSVTDQALLKALRVWGDVVDSSVWNCLPADRANNLRAAWDRFSRMQVDRARESLRLEHAAQARADLRRVHPSWWIRALKDETPAIRRAIVSHASEDWREPLRKGLAFSERDVESDHAPLTAALAWVSSLWTERLVGDLAERADDPPAIRILCGFSPSAAARLIRVAGLAKWAVVPSDPPALRTRDRERLGAFREASRTIRNSYRELAARDVAALGRAPKHALVRLGSVSLARLLSLADPYRVRWALQHVPYPVAKFLRSMMPTRVTPNQPWIGWETENLRMACNRLRSEGLWPWKWEDVE